MIRFARGETDGAQADAARALELVREVKDPQLFHLVLSFNIRITAELGRLEAARVLTDELLPTVGIGARLDALIELAWVARRLGLEDSLCELFGRLQPTSSLWLRAGREILDEGFSRAAETFAEIGCPHNAAEAHLRNAEALAGAARRAEADAQLACALSFYRSVGAARYVWRAEELLADTG